MVTEGPGDEHDYDPKLIEAFLDLGSRAGLNIEKLRTSSRVLEFLDQGDFDDLNAMYKRLTDGLNRLSNRRESQALRNAYAMDVPKGQDPKTITKRRIEFGAQHEGRKPDTVKEWEKKAINELITLLSHGLPENPEPPREDARSRTEHQMQIGLTRDRLKFRRAIESFNPPMWELFDEVRELDGLQGQRLHFMLPQATEAGDTFCVTIVSDIDARSFDLYANGKRPRVRGELVDTSDGGVRVVPRAEFLFTQLTDHDPKPGGVFYEVVFTLEAD